MGKAAILKSVKKSKPALMPLPEINSDSFSEDVNLLENFKSNVELVGGNLREINENEKLDTVIKELYPKAQRIVSQTSESNLGTVSITKDTEPYSLENIDLAIIRGEFGVSENGSVWISENQLRIHVLPFIANDLVLVLSKKDIYLHMHENIPTYTHIYQNIQKYTKIYKCVPIYTNLYKFITLNQFIKK